MSNAREYRRTETIAVEAIWGDGTPENPGHLNELDTLLQGEPTTTELEEAQKAARLLLVSINAWVSSRHLIEAAPRRQCPVITKQEIDEALAS